MHFAPNENQSWVVKINKQDWKDFQSLNTEYSDWNKQHYKHKKQYYVATVQGVLVIHGFVIHGFAIHGFLDGFKSS